MERAEKIGLGVATAGHVLLFGLLSAGLLTPSKPLKLNPPPMEISLVDEVALKSAAPLVSNEPPPPSVAPEKGPTEDAKPAPEPEPTPEPTPAPPKPIPPLPQPKPRPAPPEKPAPKPAPQPKPSPPKKDVPKATPKPKPAPEKPAPAKARPSPDTAPAAKAKPTRDKPKAAAAAPAAASKSAAKAKTNAPARASGTGKADKPKGSLLGKDFLKGIDTDSDAPRKPAPPPAAEMGPEQKSALNAEIRRQLKPHWKAPTGADADSLRTILRVQLDKGGSLVGTPQVIDQTGITPSNKSQAGLHAEQAIKAVRLASPFKLPPQFYEQWKDLKLGFDRRLSQ
ncbi:cell envelope biogenesis protein TolA [Sphingobium sp. AN558]|uniref:cell envelope biogenesis protein TolA n=1 Tax=Sphingobium sp. AN558 TaxID=3133442 RepID=UPI0030C5C284